MRVTLLASTSFVDDIDTVMEDLHDYSTGDGTDIDELAMLGGRACYQAWGRKNPATADVSGYLNNIVGQEHFSVMEHGSATFLVEGVSRYLTHEIVRHRHGQWSQLSTRYCDATEPVRHPSMNDEEWAAYVSWFDESLAIYNKQYQAMRDRGLSKKEAREAARFYLPGGIETKIVMSANMRAYRDILKKRWSIHADKEIQQLAGMLLTELRRIAPNSFADIPTEPYE